MHADQIARYGGSPGLRDQSLLSASLARPQHLATYGQSSTLFDLAAAYGFGLTNNHPFIDGNKRTAFVVMATFLELNGYTLVAPEPEVVGMMEDLASGLVSQEQMSRWLESYCDVSY
ncbi:type II toxin-antitoxin system death-on-curing family toxin [Synechococcales cyanobacterium C]|uniref:Type II toxin-antitoxin system death-on-curing family toxin n=2 Tax=Petrachloros TaxID=2918834 RepID=A0A8K2A116_9CYAN|nr:type II toxin-antitoxin system death-on-curing family toxin [Petrachloros mirabilis ULC683]